MARALFLLTLGSLYEDADALLAFHQVVDQAQREILGAFREIQAFVIEVQVAYEDGEDITGPLASLDESLGDLIANLEEHLEVSSVNDL